MYLCVYLFIYLSINFLLSECRVSVIIHLNTHISTHARHANRQTHIHTYINTDLHNAYNIYIIKCQTDRQADRRMQKLDELMGEGVFPLTLGHSFHVGGNGVGLCVELSGEFLASCATQLVLIRLVGPTIGQTRKLLLKTSG